MFSRLLLIPEKGTFFLTDKYESYIYVDILFDWQVLKLYIYICVCLWMKLPLSVRCDILLFHNNLLLGLIHDCDVEVKVLISPF